MRGDNARDDGREVALRALGEMVAARLMTPEESTAKSVSIAFNGRLLTVTS